MVEYYCDPETQKIIKEASDMKAKYFEQFPQIQELLNRVKKCCKEYGYVRTYGGRKRHFKNPAKDAYKAPNALIQGTCGDLLKIKLAELEAYLKDKKTKTINTVHDSILFEVDIDEYKNGIVNELLNLLRDIPFSVPMDWDAEGSTTSWANIGALDLDTLSLDNIK